jgi:hypothetical protein
MDTNMKENSIMELDIAETEQVSGGYWLVDPRIPLTKPEAEEKGGASGGW